MLNFMYYFRGLFLFNIEPKGGGAKDKYSGLSVQAAYTNISMYSMRGMCTRNKYVVSGSMRSVLMTSQVHR